MKKANLDQRPRGWWKNLALSSPSRMYRAASYNNIVDNVTMVDAEAIGGHGTMLDFFPEGL